MIIKGEMRIFQFWIVRKKNKYTMINEYINVLKSGFIGIYMEKGQCVFRKISSEKEYVTEKINSMT